MKNAVANKQLAANVANYGDNFVKFSSTDRSVAWSAAFDFMASRTDKSWSVESFEVGVCGQPTGWAYLLRAKPAMSAQSSA